MAIETEPETLNALLRRAVELDGSGRHSGLRFVDRHERASFHSWGEVASRSAAVAASLRALRLGAGDRVALVFPTCPDFFAAFFGVLEAGGIPVPLYPPVRLGRLDEYHLHTGDMIGSVTAALVLTEPRVRRVLGEAALRASPRLGCLCLDELPSKAPEASEVQAEAIASDDLALIQFSSGTTVEPKPVALSHRAILSQVRALNGLWPNTSEVRHGGVSWLPLYHDMGLIGCVFPALERPAELTLIGPDQFVSRPAIWLRTISRYRATISPAPNFAYGLCVEKVRDRDLEGVDLGSWRVALNGAEAVAPEVLRRFRRRFAAWGLRPEALTPVYGLSEAALAVTFSDLDHSFESRTFDRAALTRRGVARASELGVELVSVGRPLPGFELEIRDSDRRSLPAKHVGRVWIRGPSMMSGYFARPEMTARVFDDDGWLDTGDLGFLCDDALYLSGRAKDVLILRGRNHSPEEVEATVSSAAGVRTGCVVAVSHLAEGGEGEELVVMVERRHGRQPGGRVDDARLAEECRRLILAATGLRVARLLVLDPGTLPRTSSGKLRRAEALRRYLDGELAPPAPTGLGPSGLGRLARQLLRSRRALGRLGRSLGVERPGPEDTS